MRSRPWVLDWGAGRWESGVGDRRSGRLGTYVCALVVVSGLATGCLPPRAVLLTGAPATVAALPPHIAELPSGYHRIRFRWQYRSAQYAANGDGAARIAFPDTARLDFVVSGPLGGSGYALLFDDTLVAPSGKGMKRYLPATPFVWATLGRLVVPAAPDTVVRIEGDTVRADIGPAEPGADTVWRASFAGGELTGLARLSGGRVRGWVVRDIAKGRIRYNDGSHRSLTLTQVRSEAVPPFDPSVWHR
jgi:hypothetical protein